MSRKIIITVEDLNRKFLPLLTKRGFTFARICGMVKEAWGSWKGLDEDASIKE